MASIGTLRETDLHAALKTWYARPGDEAEATVDGYVVDLLRGDTVIEIQTGHFSAIRPKLLGLLAQRPVRLVHPIARERWIVQLGTDQETRRRRKSPLRGCAAQLFAQLVSFPELVNHPGFSLEVVLTQEEEVRGPWQRPQRGWRRRQWRVLDRRLLAVVERIVLTGPADCVALLPSDLPRPFTNSDLGRALGQPAALAAQMTYCLRQMGALMAVGKQGRAVLHTVSLEK